MSMEFNDLAARISIEGDLSCRLRLESPLVPQPPLEFRWDGRGFASWFSRLDRRTLSPDALAEYAFTQLFPRILPMAGWFRKAVNNDHRRLRILLEVASTALRDLPWEGLGLLARRWGVEPVAIVRVPAWRSTLAPLPVSPPLRVLGISPNPKFRYSMDVGRELDLVRPQLSEISWTQLDAPETPEALQKLAAQMQPHVLHFIGHGGCEGESGALVLINAFGQPSWASSRQLAELLPPSVRLLCLSSPTTVRNYDLRAFGRIALDASVSRLPSTIFSSAASDSAEGVKAFWDAIYRAVTKSGGVMEAFFAGEEAFFRAQNSSPSLAFALAWRETADTQFLFNTADAKDTAAALAVQLASRLADEIAQQAARPGAAPPEIVIRHAAAQREVAAKLQQREIR